MALAISNIKFRSIGGITVAVFTITASGNYAAGGDTLNLAVAGIDINALPDFMEINSSPTTPNTGSGWEYGFTKGAGPSTCLMQVFGQSGNQGAAAAFTELAAGAYPAGVTGDVIEAFAVWLNLQGQ